jgi:hypothetical protein
VDFSKWPLRVGGTLDCRGGKFKSPGAVALAVDRAEIKGSVLLDEGFSADGEVRLPNALVGSQLVCSRGVFETLNLQSAIIKGGFFWLDIAISSKTHVDLMNASVGVLADDESSWPNLGNLVLEGFVYERIIPGPTDSRTRIQWLSRQREFKPQPYLQLAKFLRGIGDDRGARRVLFEMEDRRRRAQDHKWYQRCLNQALRKTIGYGLSLGGRWRGSWL